MMGHPRSVSKASSIISARRLVKLSTRQAFHSYHPNLKPSLEPRLEDDGHVIIDDKYSVLRDKYDAPKNPIVLAHGLLGFDELRLAGPYLPGVQYWRGIKEALSARGVEVITATVPPSSSIEERAEQLAQEIEAGARGKSVNIIAHSMGGLDSRYMISRLKHDKFKVSSLTTIATPHRGSAVADYVFEQIGPDRLPQIYYTLNKLNVQTGAFAQLTRKYMTETFNPNTPDAEDVRYFSYGAVVKPHIWSVFRLSHQILTEAEGPNDGLVSMASSRWGGQDGYKGTLMGVSHLDLINWTNRLKWIMGRQKFNAIAFYLDIADVIPPEPNLRLLPPTSVLCPLVDPFSPTEKQFRKRKINTVYISTLFRGWIRPQALAAMSASATILLDSQHTHYTNLDYLSGKVVVQLFSETAIGGIQVKLEGESRTRLSGPRNPQNGHSEKKRTELEVHKILYKVATVFPTAAVMQTGAPATSYTFAPGIYEYPFQFKFPFNNSCSSHNSMLTNLKLTGLKVEIARDTNRHVKKTLPPSLSNFPDEADINYFVKATIIRPQFYKENIRSFVPIKFLPIEPPRTGNPNEETFARRQHQFSQGKNGSLKKSIFSRTSRDGYPQAPRVSVDARLPNPSILTCNEPVPLRLIAKKMTDTSDMMFLQMLQIELIASTKVIAHDLTRVRTGSTVILSLSNMSMPLGKPGDPVGTDWTIDPNIWNKIPLPNSIAPSFETCNIERSYELEIRVGMTHGTKPQLIVLPLRMPVKVYSGIAPPQALLDAIAAAGQPSRTTSTRNKQSTHDSRPPMPPRPVGAPVPVDSNDGYCDAPPSYEDAMAENLSPVDGPRREYHPLDTSSRGAAESGADAKSSAKNERARDEGPAAEGPWSTETESRTRRFSSESFDMLPTTPPESNSGSPPMSPARPRSITKTHRNTVEEESPPQYQSVAGPQTVGNLQHQPSQNNLRPMNLGVPTRKPVQRTPRSSSGPQI
ncbi:Arrestin-like N-terminal [Penicillium taxi]|uniref:Arrestin-like N-terminal n=1 Tax=Penicillium taxi TaxID=168475 RepID=UPI00254566C0|nr:Arrestin-like N-terminal [Penicillium taxi]KAJ5895573.1 Arrestin-like N-terminal [Penicillium taxi]